MPFNRILRVEMYIWGCFAELHLNYALTNNLQNFYLGGTNPQDVLAYDPATKEGHHEGSQVEVWPRSLVE